VDRFFGAFLLVGAAQRLTVNGYGCGRHPRHRGHPGDKAALERRRIKHCKDIAEVVVRRRAVRERPEPTQQIDLLFAKPRNIDEGFRAGQHGEKA
jgi:hypothetical protein